MIAKPCVLVVDPSEETREVLRTALARQGTEFLEAAHAREGLQLARSHTPDVVVLDLECESAQAAVIAEGFRESTAGRTSLVVLGTARQARQPDLGSCVASGEFVRKPYHYAPLIRKIEELLALSEQPSARRAA